jgi:hypothetical protein
MESLTLREMQALREFLNDNETRMAACEYYDAESTLSAIDKTVEILKTTLYSKLNNQE